MKTFGFLRRNLKIGSTSIKQTACKSFVRPIFEYASTVWDPYTQDAIDKIEAIQIRAAGFSNVKDMLEDYCSGPSYNNTAI